MAFTGYRDIQQKSDKRFDKKQDKQTQFRAVIVDELGNQSGTGDIWANRRQRRVWIMPIGGVQAYQVLCVRVVNPSIGLGVIVGYADPLSRTQEVLRTDYEFYQPTNTTGRSWEALSLEDLQVGGELRLWLDPRLMIPLATYPDDTGLIVNVVEGDYIYNNERVTFAGTVGLDLSASQPAGPDEQLLVGLYLDSANTLQTIDGATVSTSATPPEPSWPDGAFQLSTVLLNDTQTSISLADDITNRRILWTDVDSFGSWPFDNILSVSSTNAAADYSTSASAIAGIASGDTALFDSETFTTDNVTFSTGKAVLGWSRTNSVLSTTTAVRVLNNATGTVEVKTISLTNSQSAASAIEALRLAGGTIRDANIQAVNSSASGSATATGVYVLASAELDIVDSFIRGHCSNAGAGDGTAIYVEEFSVVTIQGGEILSTEVAINAEEFSLVKLLGPSLTGGGSLSGLGTYEGWYYDNDGNLITIDNTGMSGGVWIHRTDGLRVKKASLDAAIGDIATGDLIKLYPGTYTLTAFSSSETFTIESDDPKTCVINCSTASSYAMTFTGDNVAVRNVTINYTGDAGGCISFDGDNLILDNLILNKTTGTTNAICILQTGGTGARAYNVIATASGHSIINVAYYNTTATASITFFGGILSGTGGAVGYDIYGDQAGSTLATYGTILANNKIEWAGIYPRQSIYPMPTEPILINGHPLIWQRGTSFATIADQTYTADRWQYQKSGTMVHTVSQSSDIPTVAQIGALFSYSILVDCTTADGTIAAGDYCFMRYVVEGYDYLKIAQQQFTLPFWVKATKTGVYCVSFRNSGNDRSYVAEYTINSANTWEYKTVTVSPSPSAGTWDYATGAGIKISFALAVGSTFQTTAGAWQTGNYYGTSNQVNACDSTSNDFRVIIGQPQPGPYARPMTPNPFGNIQDLYDKCYRYAWLVPPESGVNQGQGAKAATAVIAIQLRQPVTMRTAPTLSHNITAYTSGVPGTTTVGLIDYARNVFYGITGALTVALGNAGIDYSNITFTAGTSWDGTAGNLSTLRVGPSVVAVLSADY